MDDQNDVLPTQANTGGGFEYAAHPANLNSSAANCNYAGEIIPNYTSNGSVVAAPTSTDCNVITNTYQYTPSFLTPTNFYGGNTLSSEEHYQKLNPDDVQYEQRTNYENYAIAETNAVEPMDTYQPLSNTSTTTNDPIPYDSVVKEEREDTANNEVNDFQSSLTDVGNNVEKNTCVDESQQNAPNCISSLPPTVNNYSENSSNVTSYAEPSEGIKMEPTVEPVDNDYVPDTTSNANTSVPETKAAEHTADDSIQEEIKVEDIKPEAPVDIVDIKNENNNESQSENQVPETPHENETKILINDNKFTPEVKNLQMCIRNGCVNCAVNNPEWEQEFCSNDCVILHCRNVFMAWVKANEIAS